MAKRHAINISFVSKISRCQELIMSRSGADDLYEIIKILFVKSICSNKWVDFSHANQLLQANENKVSGFVEGPVLFVMGHDVFDDCWQVLSDEDTNRLDYYTFDAVFEQLTSHKYKSNKGQYFTPRNVVDFCIQSLNISKGSSVCDPACGSGSFLKSSYDYLDGVGTFFGYDISSRAVKVSNLMSYLLCNNALYINQLDSLEKSHHDITARYDVIVANPPFAGDVTDSRYVKSYELAAMSKGRVERDVLFLERCVHLLKPNGKLAIILPDNKVSSSRFSYVRQWLLSHLAVKAVVSLDANTFKPYTSQKAVVIFAQKLESTQNTIAFYVSSQSGKNASGEFIVVDDNIQQDLGEIGDDIIPLWEEK